MIPASHARYIEILGVAYIHYFIKMLLSFTHE
jgi:hypothetical protein